MKLDNKKTIIFITLLIILLGALGFVLFKTFIDNDAIKFKKEYESLNGKINENNGNEYISISISKNNPIVYSSYEEIMEKLDGSGVILFGFPECPWCRNAIPVFLEAAKAAGIKKVYYLNNLEDRDIKAFNKDTKEIMIEKEGTDKYNALLEKLGNSVSDYKDKDGNILGKRIYFPTVIIVKDKEIILYHVSTLDSQKDPYVSLNNEQRQELKDIYLDGLSEYKACSKEC